MSLDLVREHALYKPLGGVGPDDVAITNCALCSDITSGLPVCDYCWSDTDKTGAVDGLMKAMPKNYPSRRFWQDAWKRRLAAERTARARP